MPELTNRQRECLRGFLERKTAKEIGREIGIGHYAVEQHLKAARKKLGAKSTAEAARLYFGATDTTVEPYYGPSEVSYGTSRERNPPQPEAGTLVFRDTVTDDPGIVQTLSPGQTLLAIGLSGVGMITILSLVIAVADGVAQLTH